MPDSVFYANGIGIAYSDDDVCVSFRSIIPKGFKLEKAETGLVDTVNVMMTTKTAKSLLNGLQDELQKQKKKFSAEECKSDNKASEIEDNSMKANDKHG